MFLIVIIFISSILQSMHEPTSLAAKSSDDAIEINAIDKLKDIAEEIFCEAALESFMRRTDSDLAKYIKPQLVSMVKDATSSPDSDDESASPSPKRIVRKLTASPDLVRTAPRQEIDEVVLAAVQKAFEEKEADIAHKSKKIESMFSKKATALITTVVGAIVTIASSLGSAYGTMNNSGNCTK